MAILVIIMGKGIKTMCVLCIAIYVLIQTGRVSSIACPSPAVINPNPIQNQNPTENSIKNESSNKISAKEPINKGNHLTSTSTTTTTPEPPVSTTEIPFYKVSSQVTLYTGNDQTGKKETFRWSGIYFQTRYCYNLQYYLQRKIKSLDTGGTCVELCEELDCSSCHRFHPGTPSHNRLKNLRLHNKVRSTRPCMWNGVIPED